MGGDINFRRSSYFSGCMSPSCVPVHEEYSRITIDDSHGSSKKSRRLRKIIKKLMSESKSMCGSRPLTFQYDAVSYSQNFDEGCHKDEYPRFQQIFPDFRWHVQK